MAKAAAIAEIEAACEAAIVAGVSSNALGAGHTYPTDRTSQFNLSGEVAAAIIDGAAGSYAFMCADSLGVWARRTHTAAQIQQVGQDVRTHVKAKLAHLDAKRAAVAGATTATAVDNVVW